MNAAMNTNMVIPAARKSRKNRSASRKNRASRKASRKANRKH